MVLWVDGIFRVGDLMNVDIDVYMNIEHHEGEAPIPWFKRGELFY